MICLECGRVTDVAACKVTAPDAAFAVEEHSVDFFGRCAACQKMGAKGVPAHR